MTSDARPGLVVAGATGYVGSNVVRLYDGLAPVLKLQRSRQGADHRSILFDELESAQLSTSFEPSSSALLHLVGCSREYVTGAIYDGNIRATRRLIAAARRWGIDRIVYLSGYGMPAASQSVFFRSKLDAEKMLRESGLSYAILRCSYILGETDELVPHIKQAAHNGAVTMPGDGSFRLNPVSIYDVAAVLYMLAMNTRDTVGTFDFIGDVVTYRTLATDIARRVNSDITVVEEPPERLVRSAMRDSLPLMSLSQVGILFSDLAGRKTEALCGVAPVGYKDLLELLDYGQGGPLSSASWRRRYNLGGED